MAVFHQSKVGVFVDVNDQFFRVGKKYGNGHKINYERYWERVNEYGTIVRAIAYGSSVNNAADKFQDSLNCIGFSTSYISLEPNKWHDWSVGLAVDVMRLTRLIEFDQVVLGVSSKDFVPLVQYLMDRAIKVHILAVGVAKELKRTATSWQDLQEDFLENARQHQSTEGAHTTATATT